MVTIVNRGEERVYMPKRLASPRGPHRRRPSLVATRVTTDEKVLVEALARIEGRTVTELVYDLVIPEVKERLAQSLKAAGAS